MTMPCEEITVKCQNCGYVFNDFIRGSINLELDNFDNEYLDRCMYATCPECKRRMKKSVLIVDNEGIFHFDNKGPLTQKEEKLERIPITRKIVKELIRKNKLVRKFGTGKSLEELERLNKNRLEELERLENNRWKKRLEKLYGTGKSLEELVRLDNIRLEELKIFRKNRIRKKKLEEIYGTGKSLEELERLNENRLEKLKRIKSERKDVLEKIHGTRKSLKELERLEINRISKEKLEKIYGIGKNLEELETLDMIRREKERITLMSKEREQMGKKMEDMRKYRNDF